ncbi:MAG: DUF1611 domain-containing protein [Thermoplasmata archaeon]|nr:MAG: DUF1611 domain-containing protein [Thermoplasmata archaeon]
MVPTATILARSTFRNKHGKTAHGLIRYGTRYKITSVIDESCTGEDAGELLGLGTLGIPVINEVPSGDDCLIIGVAPSGGKLPAEWREDIKTAIGNGMDIISGLHQFIGDDTEFCALAEKAGVSIHDVRRPPRELLIASGNRSKVPVVLSIGTDACVGKRTLIMELIKSARAAGYNPGFIATGQTGIMIGCDAGITIDSLPADFMSGMVEKMILDVEEQGKDIIFVEGQGAISHHAYGAVTHGILYGAQPHGLVVVHAPTRTHRSSFPLLPMPALEDELKVLKAHTQSPVLGIGLNCSENLERADCSKHIQEYEKKFGLPVEDAILGGADKIFKNIEQVLLKK